MARLSEAQRIKIWATFQSLQTIKGTAHAVGCSPKAVRLWVERMKREKHLRSRPSRGRPSLISDAAATQLLHAMEHEGMHSQQAAQSVVLQGTLPSAPSKPTIIKAVQRAARLTGKPLVCRRGLPKKELTADTRAKRVAFALKWQKVKDWSKVVFTDRAKFPFTFPGVQVPSCKWVRRGQAWTVLKPNKASVVNLYCGLTPWGMTKPHLVTGTTGLKHSFPFTNKQGKEARNITASEYEQVVKQTLLPSAQSIYSIRGQSSFTFQQDNDPTHRGTRGWIKEWQKKRGMVELMDPWPPNSPDLNPIENVWAWVNQKVRQKGCCSFKEFQAEVLNTLKNIPQPYITNLYDSMPRRISKVLEEKGGKTGY
jgi:hypothetical protein